MDTPSVRRTRSMGQAAPPADELPLKKTPSRSASRSKLAEAAESPEKPAIKKSSSRGRLAAENDDEVKAPPLRRTPSRAARDQAEAERAAEKPPRRTSSRARLAQENLSDEHNDTSSSSSSTRKAGTPSREMTSAALAPVTPASEGKRSRSQAAASSKVIAEIVVEEDGLPVHEGFKSTLVMCCVLTACAHILNAICLSQRLHDGLFRRVGAVTPDFVKGLLTGGTALRLTIGNLLLFAFARFLLQGWADQHRVSSHLIVHITRVVHGCTALVAVLGWWRFDLYAHKDCVRAIMIAAFSFGEHDLVANFRERSLAKTLQLAIEAICLGSILWPAEEAALATSSIPLFAFYSLLLMLLAETANSLSFLRARDSGLGSLMAWLSLTARVVAAAWLGFLFYSQTADAKSGVGWWDATYVFSVLSISCFLSVLDTMLMTNPHNSVKIAAE